MTRQPILSVRNVSKHFGGGAGARRGVSLDVYARRGRRARRRQRRRQVDPDQGDLRRLPPRRRARSCSTASAISFATPQEARDNGIETIYQDLALADNLSIGANIFLGREPKTTAVRLPAGARPRSAWPRRRKETMERLDFHVTRLDAPVAAFSGGQRQAVAIGRAIFWNARLVIMDEPTAALGVPEQRKVLALIKSLKAQGKGDHLHLAQSARHLRRRRPHRRLPPRRERRRAQAGRDQRRRDRPADGREVGEQRKCFSARTPRPRRAHPVGSRSR